MAEPEIPKPPDTGKPAEDVSAKYNPPPVASPAGAGGAEAAGALGGRFAPMAAPPMVFPTTAPTPQHRIGQRVMDFVQSGQDKGTFWRGILSGALTGMAAGSAKGHFGPGMAAGAEAERKVQQQQFQQRMEMTREEHEEVYRKALSAKLNQETTGLAWKLGRDKVLATEEDTAWQVTLQKTLSEIPGVIHFDPTQNMDDVADLHRKYPQLPKNLAQGSIVTVPSVKPVLDADGKPTGQSVFSGADHWYIPPDKAKQLNPEAINIPVYLPGEGGKKGHWGFHTINPGEMPLGEAVKDLMEGSKNMMQGEATEERMRMMEHRLEMAELTLQQRQSTMLTEEEMETAAQSLSKDNMAFRLDKMVGGRQGQRLKIALRAKALNPNFNEAEADEGWKYIDRFNSSAGQNIFSINKAMRHLGALGEAAEALHNGNLNFANDIAIQFGKEIGRPEIATYDAMVEAVIGEVGKGYTAAALTDSEKKALQGMLYAGQSPEQNRGALRASFKLLGEQVQDYYRQFKNGTYGHMPEQFGITMVQPDVQNLMTKYGLTPINPNAPPIEISKLGIPKGASVVYSNGSPIGYTTKDSKPGEMFPLPMTPGIH